MKKLIAILVVLWGGGAGAYWYWADAHAPRPRFKTVAVRTGDLVATINATGTIEPEEVVDVGAQVAGEIVRFGPDPRDPAKPISYGSPVSKGTVLARLDDALFRARVDQAQAQLLKAEAEVNQAESKVKQTERDLDRNRRLQAKGAGMVAVQESDNALAAAESARAALEVTRSGVAVARANLEEANANLSYTTISSPVEGVILDRRVNIGQTVVASLNAPSLFLIAKDLSRMEIWASVNETDIGSIHVGQPVRFTVGAFPADSFEGKVSQIRLNANMVQNVVTYTVVVSFDNAGGKLLPYLTARLAFEVEHRRAVQLVPKAALRWQPRIADVAPDSREEFALELSRRARDGSADSRGSDGAVWTPSGEFVRPIRVRVGISDGLVTEVGGQGLGDDTPVVVGVDRAQEADDAAFLPHTRAVEKTEDRDKTKKSR